MDIYYKIGSAYSGLKQKELAKHFYTKTILTGRFCANSFLFLILALTNGEGFFGKSWKVNVNGSFCFHPSFSATKLLWVGELWF